MPTLRASAPERRFGPVPAMGTTLERRASVPSGAATSVLRPGDRRDRARRSSIVRAVGRVSSADGLGGDERICPQKGQ